MLKYKLLHFFDAHQKRKGIILIFLMVVASLLEMISLGLILPMAGLLLENPDIKNNIFIEKFSHYVNTPYENLILYLLLFFLIFYIIKIFYLVFVIWYEQRFLTSFKKKLADRFFLNYISQNFSFFIKRNSAEFLGNITTEIDQATISLTHFLKLTLESLIVIGLLSLLIFLNPITAVSTFFIFLFFSSIYLKLFKKKLGEWGKQRVKDIKKRIQFMQEGFGAVKIIKLFGRESFFFNKFKLHNLNLANVSLKIGVLNSLPRYLTELLAFFIIIFIFFILFNTESNISEILTIITIYAVAAFKLIPSANRIILSIQTLKFSSHSISVLYSELKNFKVLKNNERSNFIFNGSIVVNIENFKHSQDSKFYLRNIKFEIKKNEKIGIIGPSGSGKSTLIDILTGVLKPEKGEVIVDKKSIFSNLRGWQNLIGYVPQKIFILDESLRNNILFGLDGKKYDDVKILSLIKKLSLEKLLNRLPNGLDGNLGEEGVNFSGGEIQRIGICRALIYEPQILFLDEATSSLDISTEQQILNELKLFQDKTIISIAHRINTLKNCSKIYCIDNGKVVDQGNFDKFKKQN